MTQFKSERHFQTVICNYALVNDWLVYVHPDSRKANVSSTPGFPDIVLSKPGLTVLIETKMHPRKISAEQLKWQEVLRSGGLTCVLAYPEDYEAIKDFLRSEPGTKEVIG